MKLLKTILNYLKNLFKKKELSLTDLVPQLKDIDHDKLFEQIRPGDIVFGVTRCDNLEKIEESHRIRPFIVAKKKGNGVYAYSGTSKKNNYNHYYLLNKDNYNFTKDTYFNLNNCYEIDKDEILYIVDSLKTNHLNKINSRLKTKGQLLIDCAHFFQEGNIIKDDHNLFYIHEFDSKNNKAIIYKLLEDKNGEIKLNRNRYRLCNKHIETFLNNAYHIVSEKKYSTEIKTRNNNKKESTFKNHYFRFNVGQKFYCGFNNYIYLFSSKGTNYGVEYYDEDEEFSNIITLPKEGYLNKSEVVDKTLVKDIVSIIAYDNKKFEWLYDKLYTKKRSSNELL